MNNVAIFAVGLLVTMLVAGAVSLLIWGAVMDGREDARRRAGLGQPGAALAGPDAAGREGARLGTLATG
ncbi:MAG: hypothetical protein M3066_03905 [Actinomycetota bacterium]|nr:hypothetical protein [Actinomycetota bacterium]